MPEGLPTLAEALAAAEAELAPASADETDTGMPPVEVDADATDEQASVQLEEQPAADEGSFDVEAQALGEALMDTTQDNQDGSEPGTAVPGSDEFWNQSLDVETVNGSEAVTIRELSEGYMRQADYTQKTQEAARVRKTNERAVQFLETFEANPLDFTKALAVQAGLIDPESTPYQEIDIAKIPTQEEYDTKFNEQVQERVDNDESVKAAKAATARMEVDVEFDRISEKYNVELKPELRDDLLQEAFKTGSSDLEGILAKRIASLQQRQQRADATKLATTSRPGSSPVGATTDESEKTKERPSMREAYQQAKVAAAQQ